MEYALSEMFPQLKMKLSPEVYSVTQTDLQNNSFFMHLVDNICNEYGSAENKTKKNINQLPYLLKDVQQFSDVKAIINKIMPKLVPVKVPKGTLLYTMGSAPDQGFFLVHGCVQLLAKKNNWERLESYPGHTVFNVEERVDYLNTHFRIHPKHFEALESIFYEDKMSFNFTSFMKLYSGEYFGFRQLLRGSMRTKMAIALEDSLIIKIRRQDYDKYLKDFEQKRQQYIINCIFSSVKPQIVEDVLPRIPISFNSAELKSFDRDDEIYKEGQFSSGLYILLQGEVVESKDVKLQVPKKYLSNENQKEVIKEVTVNLHRLIKNSFVGQIQHLLSSKKRQFTVRATLNGTLLLKLDATTFLKAVSESSLYQRELTMAAKHKYSVCSEIYLKQRAQILKSYMNQFQQFDQRKKEKSITGMLNKQANFKQNGLYQLFKRQGIFYRDTFQRLEGFQDFQAKYDPKRSSIHRHKIKSNMEQLPQTNSKTLKKDRKRKVQERSLTEQGDLSFEATKKILMSPGKSSNQFQIMGSELLQKLSPISQHHEGSRLKKKRTLVPKFQQLKKDEMVFKRVLIKNGKFDIPRETNKSNRVEAIVNHQFDEVVKQCMTRKSVALRKALIDNRSDLLKDEFRKTLSSMPQRSSSQGRFTSTSFGYTCKGTDEMKKRLEKMKWFKGSPASSSEKANDDPKLDECIGYNRQPLSSEIKHRSSITPSKRNINRSPEKIVLLNHMMKPITYTSTQI